MELDTNQNIDTAKAYLEGMLWAAYGVRIISGSAAEWQIDQVKECAKKLKEGFTKFYVYTNDPDSGIRHALMDDDGTYVPSKDEAYYMLIACSVFINFLRRKVAP